MDKELEVRIRALVSGAKDVERLSREVREMGEQRVPDTTSGFRRGLATTSRSLRQTRIDVVSLQGAVAGLGLAAALREIVQASDTFASVRGRLKLVTDGTEQLKATESELFRIAQRTRSSYESTAELYARTARNAESLGLSQQKLFTLTEATNQAIQIGGSSTQEAANGVIQFSQALASGELRGDELRSVMENMPRLTEAIAKGLDTDIGGLRDMAEQGELTADRVTQAVLSQTDTIEQEYNALPRRVGQALTQLQNDVQKALARSNVDPLIEGIDDLRETLTDPATLQGIETLANAFILAFGKATEAVSLTIRTVQFLSDSVAADVHGAATGDIVRLEDEIARLEELKEMGKGVLGLGNRALSFGDNGGSGFQVWLSDDEIDKQLAKKRQQLTVSRQLQQAQIDLNRNAPVAGQSSDEPAAPPRPGGSGSGNDSAGADKQAKAIQDVLDKLREQRDTYGQTAEQAAIYRLETLGASEAQIEQARRIAGSISQLEAEAEAQDNAADAARDRRRELERNQAADRALRLGLEDEIELLGLSERERAVEIAQRRLSTDATNAQRQAVGNLAGRLYDMREQAEQTEDGMNQFAIQAARDIQSTMADVLFDPFEQGLGGMVSGFAEAIQRMAAEAAAAQLGSKLFGNYGESGEMGGLIGKGMDALGGQSEGGFLSDVGALFGGGKGAGGGLLAGIGSMFGGGGGAGASEAVASIFHGGGVVGETHTERRAVPGALYGMAERYHTGGFAGFKANEVPTILERGEEVLTEDDPRHAKNMGQRSGGTTQVNLGDVVIEGSGMDEAQGQAFGQQLMQRFRGVAREEIIKATKPRGPLSGSGKN